MVIRTLSKRPAVLLLDYFKDTLAGALARSQSWFNGSEDNFRYIGDVRHEEVRLGGSQLVVIVGTGSIQTDGPAAGVIAAKHGGGGVVYFDDGLNSVDFGFAHAVINHEGSGAAGNYFGVGGNVEFQAVLGFQLLVQHCGVSGIVAGVAANDDFGLAELFSALYSTWDGLGKFSSQRPFANEVHLLFHFILITRFMQTVKIKQSLEYRYL